MGKDFQSEKASFQSENCVEKTCPICLFKQWPAELLIRGIPQSCNLDSFFYLPNATSMIGQHGWSSIFYSEEEETWHVFNKLGIKVGSKSEKFLNAGTENWNFNCNDSVSTPLNLHKKVKQPGDFYLQKKLTISVKKFFRSFLLR